MPVGDLAFGIENTAKFEFIQNAFRSGGGNEVIHKYPDGTVYAVGVSGIVDRMNITVLDCAADLTVGGEFLIYNRKYFIVALEEKVQNNGFSAYTLSLVRLSDDNNESKAVRVTGAKPPFSTKIETGSFYMGNLFRDSGNGKSLEVQQAEAVKTEGESISKTEAGPVSGAATTLTNTEAKTVASAGRTLSDDTPQPAGLGSSGLSKAADKPVSGNSASVPVSAAKAAVSAAVPLEQSEETPSGTDSETLDERVPESVSGASKTIQDTPATPVETQSETLPGGTASPVITTP